MKNLMRVRGSPFCFSFYDIIFMILYDMEKQLSIQICFNAEICCFHA